MLKHIIYSLFLLLNIHFIQAQSISKKALNIGETVEMHSTILNEERTINIYLPNSYHPDSAKTYHVIYLLDGSIHEDFLHIAGNVQFCSLPWIHIIPESIVVGVGNVDRKRDFTYPSHVERDNKELPTSGKSEKFIDFISKELQPLIQNNYKCSQEKTLIGQSLGGLLATQILFERPNMFDNYIIISPSLWWDDESILKSKLEAPLTNKSIYVGVGNEGPTMIRVAQTLFNKLSIEKNKEAKVYFNFFEQQNHGDILHLAVYDAFEKLFKEKVKTD